MHKNFLLFIRIKNRNETAPKTVDLIHFNDFYLLLQLHNFTQISFNSIYFRDNFFAEMDLLMKSQLPRKVEGGQTLKGSARLTASTTRLDKQNY